MANLNLANQARINKVLDNTQLDNEGKIITLRTYVYTIATQKMKLKKRVQCQACIRGWHALAEYNHEDKFRIMYGAGDGKSLYEIPKMVFETLSLPEEKESIWE